MKKTSLRNLMVLFVLILATLWFNLEFEQPGDVPEEGVEGDYILAVSWQPAFCEERPNVPECRSQRPGRFDSSNFSLHGLWPQPASNVYCGLGRGLIETDKSGRWGRLPKLRLSETLRSELAVKMPGYRSHLHRHEWYKHGSCMSGYSPETYFRVSLDLLDTINGSQFRERFAEDRGKRLSFRDIQRLFSKTFGRGTEERLVMDCYRDEGRRLIQEFKLSLHGVLGNNPDLHNLLANGKKLGRSCPAGIVDSAGNQ